MKNSRLATIALVFLLIGGVNWGLVGIFDFNLITAVLGDYVSRIFFTLIGIAALNCVISWKHIKPR